MPDFIGRQILLAGWNAEREEKPHIPAMYVYMPEEEVQRLVQDIREEIVENAQKQLVFGDINFTGKLSASIKDGYVVKVNSPYGYAVEYGLPPGIKVPYDALFKWVQGKLGITDKKEARIVTFKIRNKILKHGTKPTHFFRKAILRLGKNNKLVAQRVAVPKKQPSFLETTFPILKKIRKSSEKRNKMEARERKKRVARVEKAFKRKGLL